MVVVNNFSIAIFTLTTHTCYTEPDN